MGVHLAQDARMACCVPAPVRASCPCRIPKLSGEPGCRLSLVLCSDPGPAQEHPRGLCWPTASPAGPVSTEFTCLPLGVALPTPAAGPGVPPGPAHPTQLGTVEPLFEVQPRPTSPTSSGVLWAAPLRVPPNPCRWVTPPLVPQGACGPSFTPCALPQLQWRQGFREVPPGTPTQLLWPHRLPTMPSSLHTPGCNCCPRWAPGHQPLTWG